MKIVVDGQPDFIADLKMLSRRGDADLARVEPAVREILNDVAKHGDEAVLRLTEKFEARKTERLLYGREQIALGAKDCPAEVKALLQAAKERIARYHQHQIDPGFRYTEDGVELGSRVSPVRAAGVYAPGGKARYPSSVLMAAVPAKVAGVDRVVLATPRPTPEIFAAAEIAGVDEIYDAGGAQAIAALAHGTESLARVDKIVGPGNIFVACAKRLVFGLVSIDGIAGPSEILVVADDQADAKVVAADLLSQAEHDEDAYALCIVLSQSMADAVAKEVQAQLELLPRKEVAEASIRDHGQIFVCPSIERAAEVADVLAIEHLSLQVRDPDAMLPSIRAAGAIFLGDHTPEAAGDYVAGPSHVLPTGGAVRFGSPLGVYDFVTRSSLIRYSKEALQEQAKLITDFARLEGLEAHARAVDFRLRH